MMIGRMILIGLLAAGLAGATQLVGEVDWTRGGTVEMNINGADKPIWFAGVVTLTLDENDVLYDRDTLCVQLFTDIYVGQWYQTVLLTPAEVGPALERVSWLIDNALLPTQTTITSTAIPQADWVTNTQTGEAIQIAVWDIVQDGGDGFYSGQVQFSKDPNNPTDPIVQGLAEYYEAVSFGMSSNDAYVYENFSLGDGSPAQMLEGPEFLDNGPTPNPEPSTLVLGGAGLAAAAWLGRRKRTT